MENLNLISKIYVVYGVEGHRQRESFFPSMKLEFDKKHRNGKQVILETFCSDKTGTNDYVIVKISAETVKEIQREFDGQLSDGLFENSRYGKIIEL